MIAMHGQARWASIPRTARRHQAQDVENAWRRSCRALGRLCPTGRDAAASRPDARGLPTGRIVAFRDGVLRAGGRDVAGRVAEGETLAGQRFIVPYLETGNERMAFRAPEIDLDSVRHEDHDMRPARPFRYVGRRGMEIQAVMKHAFSRGQIHRGAD